MGDGSFLSAGGGQAVAEAVVSSKTDGCVSFDANATTLKRQLRDSLGINSVVSMKISDLSRVYTLQFPDFGSSNILPLTLVDVASNGCDSWVGGKNQSASVKTIDEGGIDIPVNVSASQLRAHLNLLPNIGNVIVSRSLPDNEGGFQWSASFDTEDGNVVKMTAVTDTGFNAVPGAKIEVAELIDGNVLGGFFTLTYGKVTTNMAINFDASAEDMEKAINSLSNIGSCSVSRSLPDRESGYTWTVTFTTNEGDLPLFTSTNSLTGTGAHISVKEIQKGNTIKGSFKLSYGTETTELIPFDAPATGSSASVQSKLMQLSNVDSVVVTRSGPDVQNGYSWTITFQDPNMPGDLPLLKAHTELLSGVGVVGHVIEKVKGSEADGTKLHVSFQVPNSNGGAPVDRYRIEWDTTSGFDSGFSKKYELVSLDRLYEEQWIITSNSEGQAINGTFALTYKDEVTSPISASASAIDVRDALEQLPSINTVYVNRGWKIKQGYTYSVTFQSVLGHVAPLWAPEHHLNKDSSLKISGAPCLSCHYIPDLTMGTAYFVRVFAGNEIGYSGVPTTIEHPVVARQLPAAPTSVQLMPVSSSSLELLWHPPANDGGATVTSYVIEWDLSPVSNHLGTPNKVPGAGPAIDGLALGSVTVNGEEIVGSPPFSKIIENLNANNTYYVRIRASNDVPIQMVSPVQTPPTNANWETSTPSSMQPIDRVPNPPNSVSLSLRSATELRLLIEPPTRVGGQAITKYKIEFDRSPQFNSNDGKPEGSLEAQVSDLRKLTTGTGQQGGVWVYDAHGLKHGVNYFVRVSAYNGVGVLSGSSGYGAPLVTSPLSEIPRSAPLAPRSVAISTTIPQSDTPTDEPIQLIDVTWEPPADSMGNPITNYKIEWWKSLSILEIQQVTLRNTIPNDNNGTFLLKFQGKSTGALEWDVSAEKMRWHLMNIKEEGGQNPLIGPILIKREALGYGLRWTITFLDEGRNPGDVPSLMYNIDNLNSFSGNGIISMDIIETRSGVRPQGKDEQQVVEVVGATGGFFQLRFEGSAPTVDLAYDVAPERMETALESLPTVGDVSVSRFVVAATMDDPSTPASGYAWIVTFHSNSLSNIGDLVVMQPQSKLTPAGIAKIKVYDGDNSLRGDASNICANCSIGELPAGYDYAEVTADKRSYQITGLVTGSTYYVRLSARNDRGYGLTQRSTPESIVPPLQVPGPPTLVTLHTKPGTSTALLVNYSLPISNGGADVTLYKIEWDAMTPAERSGLPASERLFSSAGQLEVRCPNNPIHEVQEIRTNARNGSVTNGTFKLKLIHRGMEQTTGTILYNEDPMAVDELGGFVPNDVATCDTGTCATCDPVAMTCKGSVQSQLQRMLNVDDVIVTRTPATNGGYVWSVTFLDAGDIPEMSV